VSGGLELEATWIQDEGSPGRIGPRMGQISAIYNGRPWPSRRRDFWAEGCIAQWMLGERAHNGLNIQSAIGRQWKVIVLG
jgi:hypothetical protein